MSAPRVQVVCFSMDRVFQLSEYLRTLYLHLLFHGKRLRDDHTWARVTVIAKCSTPATRSHYEGLAQAYNHVSFLFEGEDGDTSADFAARLLQVVGEKAQDQNPEQDAPLVLLTVDDAFFFDDIDLAKAERFLQPPANGTWNFAFHLKLAPSIWRLHMLNKPMLPLPPMTTVLPPSTNVSAVALSVEDTVRVFLTFDPARGTLDWRYPWELSGSVYRRETVTQVLAAIQKQHGREAINRPNQLELRGHEIVTNEWMNQTHQLRCACLPRPKMHVFAINQVQDLFDNRLYGSDPQILSTSSASSRDSMELLATSTGDPAHLLRYYESNETLDETYYRRHRFSSVHIGTMVLSSAINSQPRTRSSVDWTADHTPLVSVVMPMYNAEAFVNEALRSIQQQSYPQMEIIVIDDASTDGSAAIMAERMAEDPRIKYVKNECNLGISASLNKGFSLAQGTFVARMDSDDLAFPDRIQRQIHFMLDHPFVDILGTSILVGCEPHNATEIETAVYPTSPLATRWQLLFGCFVAHPTVMMHRRVLNTIVASSKEVYSTSAESCEDYDLWLRCAFRHDLTIMSLGDVLLYHRKHAGSTSSQRRADQVARTQATATAWFRQLLGGDAEVDAAAIQPLLDQEGVFTIDQLKAAIQLLKRLEVRLCEPTKRDISRTSSPSISQEEQEIRQDEWAAEQQYVRNDSASRQGELAFKAMMLDPVAGGALWSQFANDHPELSRSAFERIMKQKQPATTTAD